MNAFETDASLVPIHRIHPSRYLLRLRLRATTHRMMRHVHPYERLLQRHASVIHAEDPQDIAVEALLYKCVLVRPRYISCREPGGVMWWFRLGKALTSMRYELRSSMTR